MIPPLRLASSFTLTALLIGFVSASCGLDTSGTDTAGDDGGGSMTLDASGLFDGPTTSDAHGGLDATHLGDVVTADAAPPTDGASHVDAGPPVDAAVDASVDAAPPPDSSVVCSEANGCITIPGGWSLVAVETTQADACPTGFAGTAPNNVVETPTVPASACGCGACDVTTPPSCAAVPVNVYYDGFGCLQGQCGCAGQPAQNANAHAGMCNTDLYTGGTTGFDFRFAPGPATGGACSAPVAELTQNVTYAGHERVCVQDSPTSGNCSGDQCTPGFAAPYRACISQSGHQTCPAVFTTAHYVGNAASYTCAACGCAPEAKCDGTMTYYTDTMCSAGAKAFTADGTSCAASGGSMYGSYEFAGTLATSSTTCTLTAGAPSNVALTNELTVCCQP